MHVMELFANSTQREGVEELRAELAAFSYDGLRALADTLDAGRVLRRGTWDGCPLSYRHGCAGSVDEDRNGKRGNAFTRYFDAERLDEDDVRREVAREMDRRRVAVPVPEATPETVEAGRC